ncbi:MAG: radical SAM protein [Phascolarctobacterium sp.]|uniref:elongator complex protein 3 n=1 Tax=Phascolarctobacterium sp. TaxID=2049039 RepID=UPI0026DB278E|nr:radical SAM protein [Phascolarctobacterium sp.]MDO4922296.1 radical SAM protein [Phascolarctobacterium sp.]
MSILPIFIPHAGCPHQCIFCNQRAISGQKTAALAGAKAQIARWLTWLRPDVRHEAAFYGGSFTGLPMELQERLLALTDELLRQGAIGSVRLSTRPDYIDEERLALLKEHQVRLVELGVQSLDDAVLQAAGRGHSAGQVYHAHALLRQFGLQTGVQLMVGLPLQDWRSVRRTAELAAELRPDVARIYPVLVVKDTPLAVQYAAGSYVPLTLEEAVAQSAYVYERLTAAGVKVIRIGLQPDEELCAPGNIIAGPFHPSMGELVKSRALRSQLTPQLQSLADSGVRAAELRCPARLQSKLRGLKSCNLQYWRQMLPQLTLKITSCEGEEIELCPSAVPLSR